MSKRRFKFSLSNLTAIDNYIDQSTTFNDLARYVSIFILFTTNYFEVRCWSLDASGLRCHLWAIMHYSFYRQTQLNLSRHFPKRVFLRHHRHQLVAISNQMKIHLCKSWFWINLYFLGYHITIENLNLTWTLTTNNANQKLLLNANQ